MTAVWDRTMYLNVELTVPSCFPYAQAHPHGDEHDLDYAEAPVMVHSARPALVPGTLVRHSVSTQRTAYAYLA